jgi:hypothetical protein
VAEAAGAAAAPPKGARTETIVREYDAAGVLVSETTTVRTVSTPKADARPELSGYL